MTRWFLVRALVVFSFHASTVVTAQDAYAPLRLYDDAWLVTHTARGAAEKVDHLTNHCTVVGIYFACDQTVNGQRGALAIFVPTDPAGHYYTQSITPDGRANGRGDLAIVGDHWTYQSQGEEGGKPVFYRTTNVFSGRDRIHFEQFTSRDGNAWKDVGGGDEVRDVGRVPPR